MLSMGTCCHRRTHTNTYTHTHTHTHTHTLAPSLSFSLFLSLSLALSLFLCLLFSQTFAKIILVSYFSFSSFPSSLGHQPNHFLLCVQPANCHTWPTSVHSLLEASKAWFRIHPYKINRIFLSKKYIRIFFQLKKFSRVFVF